MDVLTPLMFLYNGRVGRNDGIFRDAFVEDPRNLGTGNAGAPDNASDAHERFQGRSQTGIARRRNDGETFYYSPVAPNVLPAANSHMPASSWARPPTKSAMPTTTLGVCTPVDCAFTSESTSVVDAKESRPLCVCAPVSHVECHTRVICKRQARLRNGSHVPGRAMR